MHPTFLEPLESRRHFAAAAGLTPERSDAIELIVHPSTGAATLVRVGPGLAGDDGLAGYQITSASGALRPAEWNSLADQGFAGWREFIGSTTFLAEGTLAPQVVNPTGDGILLGRIVAPTTPRDVQFTWVNGAGDARVGAVRYRPTLGAEVLGRYVFYNGSAYDGFDPAPEPEDDHAVAPDKRPLLPGGTAAFEHVTSYTKGINGVMIDFRGLSEDAGPPTAADFAFRAGRGGDPATWAPAPPPSSVTLRRSTVAADIARVTITWPDGAIRNEWLQVTVLPGARTALASDVFYFGNLVGETGAQPALAVSAADVVGTRGALGRSGGLASRFDHDRDGRVGVFDYAASRRNFGTTLPAPSTGAAAAGIVQAVLGDDTRGASPRRGSYFRAG